MHGASGTRAAQVCFCDQEWRRLETLQSAYKFTNKAPTEIDALRVARTSNAPNLISDQALPIVSLLHLNQTILNGTDAEEFTFAERFGFQALWDGDREFTNLSTKKSMHNTTADHIGLMFSRENGARITHETDMSMRTFHTYTDDNGVTHRPDLAINDFARTGKTLVLDFTITQPISRRTAARGGKTSVHCVSDHLKVAEQRKLDSQAWKNYSGVDGLSRRFEPLALGWHGDFGERFKSVCEELVTHHISQQQARNGGEAVDPSATKRIHTWRLHTLLASIQTKHLDQIGRYLFGVRRHYERAGPCVRHVREKDRRNLNLSLSNVARPLTSVDYVGAALHADGTVRLAQKSVWRQDVPLDVPIDVAIELEARDAPMIDGVAIPQEGLTQTQDEVQVEIGTSMTELLQQAMKVRTGSQELVYDRVTRTGDGNGPSHA